MKTINTLLTALIICLSSMVSVAADTSATDLPMVTGEVKKVKPKSGKITIKHEEIPNLDMPGMTMVFRVDEGTDISQFKKGDNVEFTVIEKDGKMFIVTIETAK